MLKYRNDLKPLARQLRSSMTDAEQKLWFHLRRKQLCGVQFYRQKPIGQYIADFYAPAIKLVIEVDGSQHSKADAASHDSKRTSLLNSMEIAVLRFDNLQVLHETSAVLEMIFQTASERTAHSRPITRTEH